MARPDGPEHAEVPLLEGNVNPILRLLDDWRLPYHATRAEVTARVGVSLDPIYQWQALMLPEATSLPGAMQPWTASASDTIPPQYPISRFSSLVWYGDDALANIRRTADVLAEVLGPAPVGRRWNTLVASWRSGLAEISLIAWPPKWQSHELPNPAQDRQPRLRTACHIDVCTGHCPPLSAQERHWVESFRPLRFDGTVGASRPVRLGIVAPYETELEYVRHPEDRIDDRQVSLGLSADGDALIVVSNQLYVIPRSAVLRLEVVRLTPAKGGGGSRLYALCETKAPGINERSIALAQSSDPDGLNAFAREVGVALACPVEIGPYHPDC